MKKWLVLGSTLVLGTTLLITSALAETNSNADYSLFKNLCKNKEMHQNLTNDFQLKVEDNGRILFSANGSVKLDHPSKAMSGNLQMNCEKGTQNLNVYFNNGKMVLKTDDSNTYKIMNLQEHMKQCATKKDTHFNDEYSIKLHQTIFDYLIGDLKNYLKTEVASNGDQIVSLNVSEAEIPAHINALTALGLKHLSERKATKNNDQCIGMELFGLKHEFNHPELTKDILIKQINHQLVVDQANQIKTVKLELTITGKDKAEKFHEIKLTAQANFSNIGNTVPDQVNLKGKATKTIKFSPHKRRCHFR